MAETYAIDTAGIPLPQPSELTEPFWRGCGEGRLLVQQCAACDTRFFTPRPACPNCLSSNWSWATSPGVGTVYSFTVVHRAALPDRVTPYVIAAVDLDDGWTMMTNLIGCHPSEIACGARVSVRFVPVSDDISLPMFTLSP